MENIEPKVGMLATYCCGSDRYGYVITNVISPKKIMVVRACPSDTKDKFVVDGIEYLPFKKVDELFNRHHPNIDNYGVSDNDRDLYEYDLKRFNEESTFTLRKNGKWVNKCDNLWRGFPLCFGEAEDYFDPSF